MPRSRSEVSGSSWARSRPSPSTIPRWRRWRWWPAGLPGPTRSSWWPTWCPGGQHRRRLGDQPDQPDRRDRRSRPGQLGPRPPCGPAWPTTCATCSRRSCNLTWWWCSTPYPWAPPASSIGRPCPTPTSSPAARRIDHPAPRRVPPPRRSWSGCGGRCSRPRPSGRTIASSTSGATRCGPSPCWGPSETSSGSTCASPTWPRPTPLAPWRPRWPDGPGPSTPMASSSCGPGPPAACPWC